MGKIDYFLGILIIGLGAILLSTDSVHWFAYLLLFTAIVVYTLFVVRVGKERCIDCGHYFKRTTLARIQAYGRRPRCNGTTCARVSAKSDDKSTSLENHSRSIA